MIASRSSYLLSSSLPGKNLQAEEITPEERRLLVAIRNAAKRGNVPTNNFEMAAHIDRSPDVVTMLLRGLYKKGAL